MTADAALLLCLTVPVAINHLWSLERATCLEAWTIVVYLAIVTITLGCRCDLSLPKIGSAMATEPTTGTETISGGFDFGP